MATKTATGPSVHHMLRTMSKDGMPGPNGERPADQVDADISEWVDNGYTLKMAAPAGETPGGIRMLYVLVKNGTG